MRFPSGLRVGGDLGCPMGYEIPAWAVGKVRINPVSGCWEWTRAKSRGGYGQIRHMGRFVRCHRRAFSEAIGDIPAGACVCHRCDNPACFNPGHLFVGTHLENAADRSSKGRSATGLRNGRGKADENTRIEAASMRKSGKKLREIASRFGVAISTARYWTKSQAS